MLSVEVESTTIDHLNLIILGLGYYFFLLMRYQKQKRVIRHGMREPLELKLRRFSDCLVYLNEYMSDFPVSKAREKTCEAESNEFC